MLSRERAQERLKEFQVDGWKVQRLTAVRALPGHLPDVGEVLLGKGRAAEAKDWHELQAVLDQAARELDTVTAEERRRLFEALFGCLAPQVEAAWRFLHKLPYQAGAARKAFRAPGDAAASRGRRFAWLQMLVRAVEGYDEDVAWFAAWAPYLPYGAPDTLGVLLAATIDEGGAAGDAVFRILVASASGEHEIGAMGRHVTRALLAASRPDGWEFVEKLLLAAQRQEGLRQVVLETVDEAHPAAFRRILRLILDHDLARFSATIRAMNVWFELAWEMTSTRAVNDTIATVLRLLEDSSACDAAIAGQDGHTAYLGLWALAFENASAALAVAEGMLADEVAERRFVAVHFLAQLRLPQARSSLLTALDDPDLRIAIRAAWDIPDRGDSTLPSDDLFERLERLVGRLGRDRRLSPIVWPWMTISVSQASIARYLVSSLGPRSPMRLVAYLKVMDAHGRSDVVGLLAARKPRDAETRDALFALVGDASGWVRQKTLKALEGDTVSGDEAVRLEGMLTRKAGDLRRGVLGLLLNQPDEQAPASATRLLAAAHPLQRLAGLELLRELQRQGRAVESCTVQAERYQASRGSITDAESAILDALLARDRPVPTLDDALGLFDPSQRTKPSPPTVKCRLLLLRDKPRLVTDAAVACLKSLDALVEAHRMSAVTVSWGHGSREELIGNMGWSFPQPDATKAAEDDLARLPLRQVWERWDRDRPAPLRDADGLELLRALAPFFANNHYPYHSFADDGPRWLLDAVSALFGRDPTARLRYPAIVQKVLQWLLRRECRDGATDFLLSAVEYSLTLIPNHAWQDDDGLQRFAPLGTRGAHVLGWLQLARYQRGLWPATWDNHHHARLWALLRFIDEPTPAAPRRRPQFDEVLAAYTAGAANEADLLDGLLGPREVGLYGGRAFAELYHLTARRAAGNVPPIVSELVDRCRRRILEVELVRGDLPTAASVPALALRSVYGVDTVVRLLKALGHDTLVRGWTHDGLSKAAVFSHLLRVSYPAPSDSVEDFAQAAKVDGISHQRLVELALYAPQWAAHVEHALGWRGLAESAWWLHAHTKDNLWHVDPEIRELWAAQVAERTPLAAQSLVDGAVDVTWFRRVYEELGEARWDEVYRAAQYTAGGNGHARARLFADAMLGRCDQAALVKRIGDKRHQDSVRALGLLPLADGEDQARDLLERYHVVQEFLRTSRQFGAQRQANEKLAASIALENLARRAGYPDPQRLTWAMEREAVADLVTGPVVARVAPVTVALRITQWGEPEVTVDKAGKALKNIPPAAKKDAAVRALLERQRDLKRQASRMRQSLEAAMVRGDEFTGAELRELMTHPVLAPMLRGLVLVGESLMGYPVQGGVALEGYTRAAAPVGNAERVRIAHPVDLLADGHWHRWQHECFVRERIQPFKQVFRELYVLTSAERTDATASYRYEGQQVQPQQALALLGQRGWVNSPDEGVRRTFHDCGLSAWLGFQYAPFTPAEVSGLTVESVWFSRRGEWTPIPLTETPPRLFSEVMRDVDLVVSVAHLGGVDPEATASTVEMRAGLVRETCAMLGLGNVRVERAHALIGGALGEYSIHLGSGVVHRQPGGAVCIVPVHSQHRGRLFLPFADDDPKTAEVVSKVLLLARDGDIKDPTILEQLV